MNFPMKFHLARMNNMVKKHSIYICFSADPFYHSKSKQSATSGANGSIAARK